jgi:hypothetical protein
MAAPFIISGVFFHFIPLLLSSFLQMRFPESEAIRPFSL